MIDIISGEVILNMSFPVGVNLRRCILEGLDFNVCLFMLKATMLFAELTYTLATEEAERIGVDHVARMTATGTGENSTGQPGSSGSAHVMIHTLLLLQPLPTYI